MDLNEQAEIRRKGAYREEIIKRYRSAKKANPKLTTGQFMMMSNPDRYANEESAARQYRKLESGEITGERLFNQSHNVGHYYKTKKTAGVQEYQRKFEKRRGQYQFGLWKVVLTIEYTDQDGQRVQEDRSYIAQSDTLDSNYDIPLIDELTSAGDTDYLSYWADTLYHWEDAEIVGKEVIRIERTNLPEDRQVILD